MLRHRILAGILALVLALSLGATPILAAEDTAAYTPPADTSEVTVPKGYNENDYTKLYTFLETTDGEGKKNGDKINFFGGYDPNKPDTWSFFGYGFTWKSVDGEKRVDTGNLSYLNVVGELDMSNFEALTKLDAPGNQLTKVNVSGDAKLTILGVAQNQLTELNLTGAEKLSWLDCSENQLTALDMTQFPKLDTFFCFDNQLTSLDISQCSLLRIIYCDYNKLTDLKVPAGEILHTLSCNGNQLTQIDVSKNPKLSDFYIGDNQLTELNLTNNTALHNLWCYNNQLTALKVSHISELSTLLCYGNQLTADSLKLVSYISWLDVSNNPLGNIDVSALDSLSSFNCSNTGMTQVDVSKNPILSTFVCSGNKLTSLDVSKNAGLQSLDCRDNQLTVLDLSANTTLFELYCSNNRLTTLDTTANTAIWDLRFDGNTGIQFDISKNPDIVGLSTNTDQILLNLTNTKLPFKQVAAVGSGYVGMLTVRDEENVWHYTLNALAKDGQTFQGWYTDSALTNQVSTELSVDVTDLTDAEGNAYTQYYAKFTHDASHTGTEIRGAIEPTCTLIGYTDATYCKECGALIAPGQPVAALGHDFVESGYQEGKDCMNYGAFVYTCTRCFKTETKTDYSKRGPHPAVYVNIKNAKDATCTEEGYTGDLFCSWCQKTEYGKVIPALGHDFSLKVNSVDPTCTEEGYTVYKCSRCDETEHQDIVPATGHTTELKNVREATCTEEGYTGDEVCTVCGETVKTGETIPVTDHTPELRNAKEATCTEKGYTGDTYCKDCGELLEKGTEIGALGHDFQKGETVAPTCTEEGYTVYKCSRCDATEKRDVVPATGHKTELKNAKEATCTEDGYTGDEVCTVCGETLKKGEVIPAHCASKVFTDLRVNQWYHPYTDYVIDNGLMKGVGGGKFNPNGKTTRAMLVTTLYRMAGEPEVAELSTFTDVPANQWYAKAVAWAQDNGIVKGVTDTAFAPNASVTREQAAAFLYRYVTLYLKQEPVKGADLSVYKDADSISNYAKEAIAWATAEGLFGGFEDKTIRPGDFLNRAQMAKLLTVLDQKF